MRLESIRLKNFKSFKDVTFDRLPEFCVLVGANGTGKSTLFDVFRFLKDALTYDLGEALYRLGGPRGLDDVRSRDSEGPVEIELKIRRNATETMTYSLILENVNEGKPFVLYEAIAVSNFHALGSSVSVILDFRLGQGKITTITHPKNEVLATPVSMRLKSMDTLALKVFMLHGDYPIAVELGDFLKNYHISDFNIQRNRLEESADFSPHLSRDGNNLAVVAERLYTQHPDVFRKILEKLKRYVPGIGNVEAKMEGDRVLLRFQDGAFKDPFLARNASDGTITMFAYLVLLHDPAPHPLLCVEEPEKQLYPTLLEELGEELRAYASRGGQVIASTHSPDFLNACSLDEVFWMEKKDGYTKVFRAADDPQVAAYMEGDGDKMGNLWTEGWFGKANPI
jgi:predicted ATPase